MMISQLFKGILSSLELGGGLRLDSKCRLPNMNFVVCLDPCVYSGRSLKPTFCIENFVQIYRYEQVNFEFLREET